MADKMKIVEMKIEDVVPYDNNPRLNEDAVDVVAESITNYGFRVPIIVDKDNVIICGHTRRLAALKLGLKVVPVIVAADMPPEKVKAFRLDDNKTAELSTWEFAMLKDEITELKDAGYDIETLAFGQDELARLMEEAGKDEAQDEPDEEGETAPDAGAEVSESEYDSVRGGIYRLGDHRLVCGDCCEGLDVARLLEGDGETPVRMWLTDPPYNVGYVGRANKSEEDKWSKAVRNKDLTIANDNMSEDQFAEFIGKAFQNCIAFMEPGSSYYIFHAHTIAHIIRKALLDNDTNISNQLIWVKNHFALGWGCYLMKHEPCQPAGTMVRTPNGDVPIENLRVGDVIVPFGCGKTQQRVHFSGCAIDAVAKREYHGKMYEVFVDGKSTKATNNHLFTVRFTKQKRKVYCTYLMRRGNWWRVGRTATYDARGFGLKERLRHEKGEEAWLIAVHNDKVAAEVAEQTLSVKYGIPFTHWEPQNGVRLYSRSIHRTKEQIASIYAQLDLDVMHESAKRLLEDNGRDIEFPLLTLANMNDKFSCRATCQVNACNIIPEIMQLPIPRDKCDTSVTHDWRDVEKVNREDFDGYVYSMNVPKYGHYIADGIITHNCYFGWKNGAPHRWFGAHDATTTTFQQWDIVQSSKTHPTTKPVDMLKYFIKNSSEKGDIVLDTFGGSGSTLIACEQTGRVCRMMEILPKYCDAIRKRYAEFVHGEGCDWQSLTPKIGEVVENEK